MRPTLHTVLARLHEALSRKRLEAERDEEFAFHLDMEIAQHMRRGLSEAEARRRATIAFGGRERFREEVSEARGIAVAEHFARDLRYALRRLRRAPAFTVGATSTLGLAIGAAAGISTIVYGVLFRDLPYRDPEPLVRVSLHTPGLAQPGDLHTEASFVHLTSAQTLSAAAAYYTNAAVNLTDGEVPERIHAGMVTPSAFPMLGAMPVVGRLFTQADADVDGSSGDIPVLISQELWERRYGADSSLVGGTIEINRSRRLVVGVLSRDFDFPYPSVSVWYPASIRTSRPSLSGTYLDMVARLAPGVTIAQAEAELNALIGRISERFPDITRDIVEQSGARVTLAALRDTMVAPVRPQLMLLGVMVLVVLLVATTNVVNLVLLRSEQGSHEVAIATSLGARWGAVAQRHVAEALVIGAGAIVVALPLAAAIVGTKFGFTANEIPRLQEVSFSAATMGGTALTAVMLAVLIGVVAFARSWQVADSVPLGDRLRGAARVTASAAWRRVQRALVAMQIAITLALLVAGALVGRSFWNLRNAPIGFDPVGGTTFEISLPFQGYATYGEGAAFHAQVLDRLRALPGVRGAAAVMHTPLTVGVGPGMEMRLAAFGGSESDTVASMGNAATPDYFRVMGIPMRHGRTFAPGDLRADFPGVVLSEALSRALFGSANPIGRRIYPLGEPDGIAFQVIGVAGDVHGERIEDGPARLVYFPLLRDADGVPPGVARIPYIPRWVRYVVRSDVPLTAAMARDIIRELDPRIPVVGLTSLQQLVDAATARVRLTMLLLVCAGGAALLLGVGGLYSVVAYAAAGRTREFGVRMALGATPMNVRAIVLREGILLSGAGLCAGLALALATTRFLRALLYEVSTTDAPAYGAAAVLLAVVTLAATRVPARRAARLDPAVVLRGE